MYTHLKDLNNDAKDVLCMMPFTSVFVSPGKTAFRMVNGHLLILKIDSFKGKSRTN